MVTSLMVRLTRCSSCWDVSGIAHLLRPYRLNPLTPIGFIANHSILYSVPHRANSHEAGGSERVAPTPAACARSDRYPRVVHGDLSVRRLHRYCGAYVPCPMAL